jgi:NADPH:quinone reductase-like Zn-dependent oxidoreductase
LKIRREDIALSWRVNYIKAKYSSLVMKAAVFREYNKDPEQVVKIEDIDTPKLRPNEVLIKVESAAYNYNDLWAIWGDPIKTPLPHISGSDVAGTVVEVGQDVTKFKVGDRVVSHSNMSCRVCDNVSFNDSAAVSMVGMTSWHMLVGRAKIRPGQTVLIMGGTSGVGMVGIQIAKLYNCTVIATAGNTDKMDKCLEIGADQVVNHREADWYKKVREITKKQGVDIIFEHIGKAVFAQEVGLLKNGGTLVATGATTGYDSTIDLRYLFFKATNLLGSTQGTKAELEEVIYWTSKGKIKPVIHTILPFNDMVKGHTMMAKAEQMGKIVTTPQKL